jgi:chalcone isomerase-like protein
MCAGLDIFFLVSHASLIAFILTRQTAIVGWMRVTLLPTSCLLLVVLLAVELSAQPIIVERESGLAFPVILTPPGGNTPHQLTGTATRERTIFRMKVYAYGLYVDADAARALFAGFAGRPAAALEGDPTFFRSLLDIHIPMTLRLVMARDVAGQAIAEAFDDALKPRVERVIPSHRQEASAALEQFRSYFNLNELARGTEIVFSCSSDGRLNTTVDTQMRPEIRSPELCRALFDVYLGDTPISTSGRRNLVRRFPALLARQ